MKSAASGALGKLKLGVEGAEAVVGALRARSPQEAALCLLGGPRAAVGPRGSRKPRSGGPGGAAVELGWGSRLQGSGARLLPLGLSGWGTDGERGLSSAL